MRHRRALSLLLIIFPHQTLALCLCGLDPILGLDELDIEQQELAVRRVVAVLVVIFVVLSKPAAKQQILTEF